MVASLALHHISTLESKRALYGRVYAALGSGGTFVNADAMMPAASAARRALYREWADHMVVSGIEEQDAWRHFEEWAEEDTYFPLNDEIAAMTDAGFVTGCVWRQGPMVVVVGRKQPLLEGSDLGRG